MAGTTGRVLLITAWVAVVGGLAGGAGYLHSLGPPEGPPSLAAPETAPEPEAPPQLESHSDSGAMPATAPGHADDGLDAAGQEAGASSSAVGAGHDEPVDPDNGHGDAAAVVALDTPELPHLDEAAGHGATTATSPESEALRSLSGEVEHAADTALQTAMADAPESLAELTAVGGTPVEAAHFEPATDWPVTAPGLHGPMPMMERQAIDLATPGADVQAGDVAHETVPAREAVPELTLDDAPDAEEPHETPPQVPPPPSLAEVIEAPEHTEPQELDVVPPPAQPDHADAASEPAVVAAHDDLTGAEAPAHESVVHSDPTPAALPEADQAQPVESIAETPASDGDGATVVAAADQGLSATPDDRVVEAADVGPLPVVGASGERAADVYARPFDSPGDRPVIGIVISGLGLSSGATESAIQDLPAAVSLSFSPYSGRLQDWIALARAAGHEVLIDLPMEPADFPNSDPGPQALMTGLSPEANMQRLEWVLSRGTNYVGVGSFMGSRFSADAAAMRPVLEAVSARGLIYLDNGQAIGSVAPSLGTEIGLPLLVSDLKVDQMAARQMIDDSLARIEEIAIRDGAALALGTAYPVTIERLAIWTRGLADRGISLAPASALVGR